MRILSWNVNGIRACDRNGFRRKLRQLEADVFAVQEVRATTEQMPRALTHPRGFVANYVAAERKGYSGVGIISRSEPNELLSSLGVEEFDREGRFLAARFDKLVVASIYFPNGNGKNRDNSRVPFKLRFYDRVREVLNAYSSDGLKVVAVGDFNTAHHEIDLARPKQNKKTSGFLPNERAALQRWLDDGWVDTFRAQCSEPGQYTWWSQRFGIRAKNIGWRLDYVLANAAAAKQTSDAFILPKVKGSDHCPIGVELRA